MAEVKKKTAPKVIDIHKPGKTAATATAKPVIVTNRQILRDPMVTEESTTPVEEPKAAPSTTAKVVAPPSAPPVPVGTDKSAEAQADEPKLEAPIPPLEPEITEAEQPEAEVAPVAEEVPKEAEPTPEAAEVEAKDEPTPEAPAETEEKPTDNPPAESEPEPTPTEEGQEPAKEESADKPAGKPKKDGETAEVDEDAAAAEHAAAIQKLADSKQFFLPINAVEKRRVERFIALGIFLSLLLAVAWLDIALDAGIIHIDHINPVTHFFSN